MTAPQRLRIGIVGAGRRGRQHAATILDLDDLFGLVAICDVAGSAANELAGLVAPRATASGRAAPQAYSSLGECFNRTQLDAVVISTPPDSHHLVARAAAAARIHMLIETPLAPTRAMMDAIADAVDEAGVKVEVGENYGRRPAEQLNRRAITAGAIGDLVHFSAFNAPVNHGTIYHMVSLLRLYAGADVAEVAATEFDVGGSKNGHQAVEKWTVGTMTFTNGVSASVQYVSSWASPLRWGRPRIVTVDGAKGYISSSDSAHVLHVLQGDEAADDRLSTEGPSDQPIRWFYASVPIEYANPFAGTLLTEGSGVADGVARAAQLASLHSAITTGGPTQYGLDEARRSQEIGIALAEAARIKRPIAARLQEPTGWERAQHEAFRQSWGADPISDQDLLLKQLNDTH